MARTSLAGLAAAVALGPQLALAADENTQLWVTGTMIAPIAEDVSGTFSVSQRFREGTDQIQVRAGADFRLSDRVSLTGAAIVADAGGLTEFRPQQQITLRFGRLALRSRVEQRFFDGADRMELRLGQLAQVTVPLAKDTSAAFGGELYYTARSRNAGADARFDQWRLTTALTHRLSDHFDATIGYLFVASPQPVPPDRIGHVTQMTITWRP